MMPPFIRRCPECGHVGLRRRFDLTDDPRRVECPACGHRFEPIESPWLN
jgi:DNA-directed RNA polymerase subunit RPC12/RpoP